ncbi:MAG: response regulator [Burkholderiaceae bacterium]
MPDSQAAPFAVARKRFHLPARTVGGLVIAAIVVTVSAALAYRSMLGSQATEESVAHTLEVLARVQTLLDHMKDAESGQRGYLLTGTENYLARYTTAQTTAPGELASLRSVTADNPRQAARIAALEPLVESKLTELRDTVTLRRSGDIDGAVALVRTDLGKVTMDSIRALIGEMQADERGVLASRQAESDAAVRAAFRFTMIGATVLLLLIATAAWALARGHREREIESWLRAGVSGLAEQLLGERRMDAMCAKALAFLARYLDVPHATVYAPEGDGRLHRVAGYADGSADESRSVAIGEGLVGQAAKDNDVIHVRKVPADYLEIRSSLGRGQPRELLVAPATVDGQLQAIMEFAFLREVGAEDRELLARISEVVAVAIRSSRERDRVDALLAETQQQAEELQAQQEELRVSNEELEEQGQALKVSQAQLEGQQSELEQTNSQLEEQAQLLEDQKATLVRSQNVLVDKAEELERSNQYKSEFLANMSHELRTPLNSTLILSKLLADNKHGNLTDEQVKFADTILSAGNDLLTLINDILDLSKIEAGKVDIDVESVPVNRIVEALVMTFEPIARDKGLAFTATVEPGTPLRIETDPQRIGQVVRNLLSNAFKFTARGEVGLRVFTPEDGKIAIAVSDSGIGIAPHEQEVIFEAFRQADGSTHRRFGGTGLGLSISRDLARLLGGDVVVQSTTGQGSVFTLTLPIVFVADGEKPARLPPTPFVAPPPPSAPPTIIVPARANEAPGLPPVTGDDRDRLAPHARLILVIEDDKRFAAILQDLAHEMGFQCVIAHSAGDGLSAAKTYRPNAILLDMNLPDHSGLGVLDQLKRDPDTRHIPVHVASVADYRQEARELGAVGYDLKPVKREQLVEALEGLRARFTPHLRRVLVVEDDARQLESIRQLLESDGVQIVGASRASDALAHLQGATFDCMVMDLNLPDLSGYDLLEKMAAHDDVAFPPVIVYTGRLLTRSEEQRLSRYSRSIIIKDARSPERLLDEVTLFLHQVEADLPPERQRMLREARSRESTFEGRRVLVVEDDVRNVFALTSVLEPKGLKIEIARNGREALEALAKTVGDPAAAIDLVLMDIMMPEMDGYTAMRQIRKDPRWKKLPIIALTAKAMRDDQEKCLAAGANDYVAKPLDVEKLLSLVRVWMPK